MKNTSTGGQVRRVREIPGALLFIASGIGIAAGFIHAGNSTRTTSTSFPSDLQNVKEAFNKISPTTRVVEARPVNTDLIEATTNQGIACVTSGRH